LILHKIDLYSMEKAEAERIGGLSQRLGKGKK
jgi:hypothetical protein